MEDHLRRAAARAAGALTEAEGMALHEAGLRGARLGPLLEVGPSGGRSSIYLGAAARASGTVLFSVHHHRGSEEQQPGRERFTSGLVGPDGRIDSLPGLRRTLAAAGLEPVVILVVGDPSTVAAHWRSPLGLVLIDGGQSEAAAQADYGGWARLLCPGGVLAVHGKGPAAIHILRRALASGSFIETVQVGSLRALERRPDG